MFKKFWIESLILGTLLLSFFISSNLDFIVYNYYVNFDRSYQEDHLKKFFIDITKIGDSLWYFMLSVTFVIITYFIINSPKLFEYKKIYKKIYYINSLLFLAVFCSGIITQILKHLIGRPRPNTMFVENEINFRLLSFDSGFHSFPSGHTSTIFVVVLVFALILPRLKYFFYLLAGVVSVSRVVVGAHHIADIVGGVCVAFIAFKLAYVVFKKITKFDEKNESIVITNNILVLVLTISIVLAIFLTVGPTFDIFISGLFYIENGQFLNQSYYLITIIFRKFVLGFALIYILLLPLFSMFVPIHQIYFNHKFKIKEIFFIWTTTIFNLFIVVNLVLKNSWGRARPNEIIEFGGRETFTPWYLISNQCDTNCSFVSGDAAVGFSLIIFFFFIKKEIYFWAALMLGSALGLIRISEGGHFFSDIIFSYLIIISFNYLSYSFYSKKNNA